MSITGRKRPGRTNLSSPALRCALVIWVMAHAAEAATIYLRNGRTLQGDITFQDEQFVYISIASGGELILPRQEVVEKPTPVASRPTPSPTIPATPTPAVSSYNPVIVLKPAEPQLDAATPQVAPQAMPKVQPLRKIKLGRIDKQPHRTLLARRFAYHVVVEEPIDEQEARLLLLQLMNQYRKDEPWADAIEIRLYGVDSIGRKYDWPFAVADYAPEGDWDKAQANTPREQYLVKIKVHDKVQYFAP